MDTLTALRNISGMEDMRDKIPTMSPNLSKYIQFTALPHVAASGGAFVVDDNSINRRMLGEAVAYLDHYEFARTDRDGMENMEFTSETTKNGFVVFKGHDGMRVNELYLAFPQPDPFNPAPAKNLGWRTGERINLDMRIANAVEYHNNRVADAKKKIGTDEEEEWMRFMEPVSGGNIVAAHVIATYIAAGIPVVLALKGGRTMDKEERRRVTITHAYRRAMWQIHGFARDEYPFEEHEEETQEEDATE
jgi:hypothetical protein